MQRRAVDIADMLNTSTLPLCRTPGSPFSIEVSLHAFVPAEETELLDENRQDCADIIAKSISFCDQLKAIKPIEQRSAHAAESSRELDLSCTRGRQLDTNPSQLRVRPNLTESSASIFSEDHHHRGVDRGAVEEDGHQDKYPRQRSCSGDEPESQRTCWALKKESADANVR